MVKAAANGFAKLLLLLGFIGAGPAEFWYILFPLFRRPPPMFIPPPRSVIPVKLFKP
jgi:hypothetical protein